MEGVDIIMIRKTYIPLRICIYFMLSFCLFIASGPTYADNAALPAPQDISAPELTARLIVNDSDPAVTEGVRLSWTEIPGMTYYRVFRTGQSGDYAYPLTDFAVEGLSYIDVKTRPDMVYYYVVCALISEGNSLAGEDETYGPRSNEVMVDVHSTPPGPVADNGYILLQINNPIMEVDGHTVEVDPGRGTAPILRNERTVLPIRAVVEAMNGEALWGDAEQKITLLANGNRVEMWIDNKNYLVDGEAREMDIEPFIENERTYVPLRFAAYNLNCRVTWLYKTEEILIVYYDTQSVFP